MRWMIGMLLVANLVVFLWWHSGPEGGGAPRVLPKPDVGTLLLLSEIQNQADQGRHPADSQREPLPPEPQAASGKGELRTAFESDAKAASPLASGSEPAGRSPAMSTRPGSHTEAPVIRPTEQGAGTAAVGAPSQSVEEIPEPPVADTESHSVDQTPEPPVAEAESQSVEKPPQPLVADTGALGEGQSAESPVDDAGMPEVQQTPQLSVRDRKSSNVALACWELVPEKDEAQFETLRLPQEMETLGVAHARTQELSGYYVLIPAQKDRDTALALVRRLKEKGIRDFWLFRAGPLNNAISLGMFNREKNAQQRKKELARLGFSAEVRARYRTNEVPVLHVKGPNSPAVERRLRRVFAGQVRSMPCPVFESP